MKKNTAQVSGFEYVKSSGGIHEYTLLSNGLRVLIKENHTVPVATCMVTYHVGSRDEAVGHTGYTHILEHLLFKRSKNYGANYWLTLMDKGAQQNATTWLDRTNYYHTLPVEHLKDALGFEADRMRNATFTEEEVVTERPIVLNELEFRVENEPMEQLDQDMWATAYQAHPYHHPTIGWRPDIENATHEKLKQFYDTFYWPNNATVTIIGDVSIVDALTLVKETFGPVPSAPHDIPKIHTQESKQLGPRRVEIRRSGQTNIVAVAYKSPAGLHKDTFGLAVLSRLLAEGKSSRLYRALVDKGLATSIAINDFPFKDPGLFSIYITLAKGISHAEAERALFKEIDQIKKRGVTVNELKRAIAQVETESSFSRDGSYSVSGNLNEAIALGDWTFYTRFKDEVARVTVSEVKRIANTYFMPEQSTTGWYVGSQSGKAPQKTSRNRLLHGLCSLHETTGGMQVVSKIKESATEGGVLVMTIPTGVEDAVTITGSLFGGTWFGAPKNPAVPELLVRMLDEGTKKTKKGVLADKLEGMGASLEFSVDEYRVRFVARCVKKYVPAVVKILAEELRTPAFPEKEFLREKKRLLSELSQAEEETAMMAAISFRQALFDRSHPNYLYSPKEFAQFAKKVTVRDLKDFHAKFYGTDSLMIVFAGDVDHAQYKKEVEGAFLGWQAKGILVAQAKPIFPAKKKIEKNTFIPEKGNVDITFGNAIGISRTHKDFYPLTFGMFVLGGSFSARLMREVREKRGLTYGIRGGVSGAEGGKDGFWVVRAMFAPKLLSQGREATLKEIGKIAREGITSEELNARKETIRGAFTVGTESSGGLAGALLKIKEDGLPKEHLTEYLDIIEKLTLKEVNDVLKKYVSDKNIVISAAGTIESSKKK